MSDTFVPLVDLRAQYLEIQPQIDAAVRHVIDTTSFINGPEVSGFEAEFASAIGVDCCVGVASGTAALMLALHACEIGPGDEVIVPSHTFVATAEAVRHVGATPVFVDVEEDGFNIDPAGISQAITERTRAILPVHLYGHAAQMDKILDIARQHGLWVVEDAAQAHLGEHNGSRCGGIGDVACFSFYPGKNLGAYGDAGAVTGNNKEIMDRVRRLRDHGRSSKYLHETVGYGERLDALQAAILRAKLPHLDGWTSARNRLAEEYRVQLADLALTLPRTRGNVRNAYHLFVIELDNRDKVLESLKRQGIGAGIHYPVPLHLQPAFAKDCATVPSLQRTERLADRILSLPLYPEMTDEQLSYVVNALKEAMKSC